MSSTTVVVLPVGLGFNDFLRLKLWFSFEFGLIPEVLLDLPVGSFVLSQIRCLMEFRDFGLCFSGRR
ncbi:hypothetical protein U1Q18_014514 [Sarracenia purpurea var. burkii]